MQHECAAGTMGNQPKLDSPACNGLCIPGHYCPRASTAAEVCPAGTVGEQRGLQSAAQCDACPAGYWCNSGKKFPCAKGYYTASGAPSIARTDLDSCKPCPQHSTTEGQHSATVSACMCDTNFYLDPLVSNGTCTPCPTGTQCDNPGTTLSSLPVIDAYWKPSNMSVIAKPCPFRSTCSSGSTPTKRYNVSSTATCTPGKGVAGVYCMLCAKPGHYFDQGKEACNSCADESGRVLLFIGGILLLIVALGFIARYHVLARAGLSVVWHTIVVAAHRVSLRTKVKISISYYQARSLE